MTTFPDIPPKIAKLLRLLASDKPGELVASAHALRRVLSSAELDLHDLANMVEFAARREIPRVETTADNPFSRIRRASARNDVMREMLQCCDECSELLTNKERAFIRSMMNWRGQPTSRQLAWLSSLYERCMKGEHAT
jgi:hypothetical protein